MRAVDGLEALELVGSTQQGLVTAAQARTAGVSKMQVKRLADAGIVQHLLHGVYALPSAPGGPVQSVRAAWLATGSRPAGSRPLAVVSGESAAAVHRLGDLVPSVHEFSTAVRRQSARDDVRYRKRDLPAGDVTTVDGLPVTTVARTVADLAAAETDSGHLAAVVRDAYTSDEGASDALAAALGPAAKRFGVSDGDALLIGLLKAAGYRPDARTLGLAIPEARDAVVRAIEPHVRDVVAIALAARLRELVPDADAAALRRLAAEAPPPHAFGQEVQDAAVARLPGVLEAVARERLRADETAARRTGHGATDDRDRGGEAAAVAERQAPGRGEASRRRG
ncbi:type IV toxin-antitoxin system AbiEi family antitoxin domain-containing protein [Amycolatopsis rubida]|uniref:Transcriptional regulator, predicted component of viral defense system n=1 Tax=Amycolatopsis rubida TaxID=112413 RepID=A0A1I6BMD6_9PSEU|nr:type IV toxin-antitoxin system AbiEi family antitoxin domain-containing protein [Amycolatopsis rubida]SFQ81987.1 Transcriptional regulator, predicted component of viral defense system [Amycolatopsis rubida]